MAEKDKPDVTNSDVKTDDVKKDDTQDSNTVTVKKEEWDNLQEQMKTITAAQSAADKRNSELLKNVEDLTAQKNDAEKGKQTVEERIDFLEKQTEAAKVAQTIAENKSLMLKLISGKGIPEDLALQFVGKTAEETDANFKALEAGFSEYGKTAIETFIKGNGRDAPGDGDKPDGGGDLYTAEEIPNLTREERKANPDKFTRSVAKISEQGANK